MINYSVPASELDAKVDALANELVQGTTLAIRWTKTVMNIEHRRIAGLLTDAALAYETMTNASADHQEAVHAFIEKRQPKFTGNRSGVSRSTSNSAHKLDDAPRETKN